MGSLTLTISYSKNTGVILSPTDVISLYFFGTPPKNGKGEYIDSETIAFYIADAQRELETHLNLKFNKTYIIEDRSFFIDDWIQWGYMPTSYPVVTPKNLAGYINDVLQVEYPISFLKSKSQSPDEDGYYRSIYLVPNGGSGGVISTPTYVGITPHIAFFGNKRIPYYWKQEYVTGFNTIPVDLVKMIGMLAALQIFIILQDALYAGITNKSLGIDGLSQSVGINSKGIYAARIEQYVRMINEGLLKLKNHYVGILFTVC